MKVTALAGGVGGGKLLVGLQRVLGEDLTAIVNTGDDAEVYGVHVSPDVDIVTYWLAGLADTERGWGIAGDTFRVVDALGELGQENWFRLGDRDFALCLHRTLRMRDGVRLSKIADEVRRSLGIAASVLPMSDDAVRTRIATADGRELEFQEYFVRERQEPEIERVFFTGLDSAEPAPGVLEALREADVIVLCPSNPLVSVGPILALPGVRAALQDHPRVVAISPIVGGKALKGPADRMLRATGTPATAAGVAGLYRDFCTSFVLDRKDAADAPHVAALGMEALVLDTIMSDLDASERLARETLAGEASGA